MGSSLGIRWPAQGDKWRWIELRDQWSRKWGCNWDFSENAGAPIGVVAPVGWHDRLNTPPKYMRFESLNNLQFRIDVEAWLADLEYEHDQYRNRLNLEAMAMSPADAGGALLGDDPDGERGVSTISPALLRRVGPPPNPIAPIRALQVGNKYVLGLSDKMPQWAKPFFTPQRAAITEFPDAEDEDGAETPEPSVEDVQRHLGATAFPDADEEESPLAAMVAGAASGGGKRRR